VYFAGDSGLPLSTGRPDGSGGDGQQASHWKADDLTGQYIGIMDPTIARGDREVITANDLIALDSFGYQPTTRTLSVAQAQGAAGSTVTIPVNLSEGSGISSLRFTLSFNPTILSPVAMNPVVLGSLVPSNFSVSAHTAAPGQVTVIISPPTASPISSFNSGGGSVVQLTFQVTSTATSGATTALTLSDLSASDANGHAMLISSQDGTFMVTAVLRGDVNQDGVINVQDLIRLIQHLTGERPLTGNGLLAADVNGDGVVNVQDLIRLIQHLTGERPL
jgi:hypothetical protein